MSSKCSSSQYFGPDPQSQVLKCIACSKGCTQCYYDFERLAVVCTSCESAFQQYHLTKCTIQSSQRELVCSYLNQSLVISGDGYIYCQACPYGCKFCYYEVTSLDENHMVCSQCQDNFTLNFRLSLCQSMADIAAGRQACNDATQTYYGLAARSCQPCPSPCKVCRTNFLYKYSHNQPYICSECEAGYQLIRHSCVRSCAGSQTPLLIESGGTKTVCVDCPPNCLKCMLSNTMERKCFRCSNGYYIYRGLCLESTKNGSYLQIALPKVSGTGNDMRLIKCPAQCAVCSVCQGSPSCNTENGLICYSCAENY